MNLLIFVLTLLLVISSISYQSLDNYRIQALKRLSWDYAFNQQNICQSNHIIEAYYHSLKKDPNLTALRKPKSDLLKERETSEGSATINFRFLVDPDYPNKYPELYPLYVKLFTRLTQVLYDQQSFFMELEKEHPQFMEELIRSLMQKNQNLPDKQKIKKIADLNQLLQTPEPLADIWHQLLRPNPINRNSLELIWGKEAECQEVSLLDYLGSSYKLKIRLYLAPRALLLAIYGSSRIMEDILIKRKELHRLIKNNLDSKAATEEFKSLFSGRSDFEPLLDFTVTKTDPNLYEK